MFERYTHDARQVVVRAQEQARDLQHNYIGTEHLLLGLLAQPGDVPASRVLGQLGYTLQGCRAGLERIVGKTIGKTNFPSTGHIPFTPRCKKVLELALRESLRLKHNYIGPEHILLALLREGDGVAAQILGQGGHSFDVIRQTVLGVVQSGSARATVTGEAMTPAADEVLVRASRLAAGAPVGSHHLLEALAADGDSMAGRTLAALGIDVDALIGQVDTLDIATTTDVTVEQAAAARMRMRIDGEELHLVLADPASVERARSAVAAADGELRGDGPLAGAFIALRRAVHDSLDAVVAMLETGEGDESAPAPRPSARDRLRRRRK